MSDFDALIIALADGLTMRESALAAGMPSAAAVREARSVGWPDLTAVRAAADEIRERHASPPPEPPTDLPGGDTVPPRRTPDPIPIEPDVEAAMAAGAAAARQARDSIALDRDHVAREVPGFLDPVTEPDDVDGRERQPQPAAEATGADDALAPMAGHGLAAAVPPDELIPERSGTDALLIEDASATLEILDRIVRTDDPLTPVQRARSTALEEVIEMTRRVGDPTAAELLALVDYVITGAVPPLVLDGTR